MNKIAAPIPTPSTSVASSSNNSAQLIKDKVGAGMSNEEVAFIGPDGIFVDELITQGGDAVEGIWTSFGGISPRASSLPRARSS